MKKYILVSISLLSFLYSNSLELVKEEKFSKLLNCNKCKFEASGVTKKDDDFYVVFDNMFEVAKVDENLKSAKLLGNKKGDSGFEGISYDDVNSEFMIVTESIKMGKDLNSKISIYDLNFNLKKEHILETNFDSENKGFEGIKVLNYKNRKFIFALCEGNECKKKKSGRGIIKIYEKNGDKIENFQNLKLPKNVEFEDFSGIDIKEDEIAIVSQSSSTLWISELKFKKDKFIVKDGEVFKFPKSYKNIEGITILENNKIVVVSDKAKKGEDSKKEQSIHIFKIK